LSKILLRDVAGAREFINRAVNAAEDIAIAVTGKSDAEVRARLQESRENLTRDLSPLLGAPTATQIAEAFCDAVMGEKREREAISLISR
jgi:hypothetical protein